MWQSGFTLRFYLVCSQSYETIFVFGCHISFCCFFALKVVRGHDFWTHLQTCTELVDLLPPILDNGTVSGEMGSSVTVMPMVIKFGPCD